MVDEIFDRTYRSGRANLHNGIDRAVAFGLRSFASGFARLNRIAWKAPWANGRHQSRNDCAGLA